VFDWLDGELVAGDREITTREAAIRRAQALAVEHAGATAIRLVNEPAGSRTGMVLAAFGEVPKQYGESQLEGWKMEPITFRGRLSQLTSEALDG
jgi:hypothetical protein